METQPDELKSDKPSREQELENQLKRIAADFDNYRKRTEEERRLSFKLAQAETLLAIAPVLDNFKRATSHLPDHLKDDKWATGVMYIEKQLEQILDEFGISKIKTLGEEFNPQLHEAISIEPSEDIAANSIITELESGYMLDDTVLKPAKVKVSSGQQQPSPLKTLESENRPTN